MERELNATADETIHFRSGDDRARKVIGRPRPDGIYFTASGVDRTLPSIDFCLLHPRRSNPVYREGESIGYDICRASISIVTVKRNYVKLSLEVTSFEILII